MVWVEETLISSTFDIESHFVSVAFKGSGVPCRCGPAYGAMVVVQRLILFQLEPSFCKVVRAVTVSTVGYPRQKRTTNFNQAPLNILQRRTYVSPQYVLSSFHKCTRFIKVAYLGEKLDKKTGLKSSSQGFVQLFLTMFEDLTITFGW